MKYYLIIIGIILCVATQGQSIERSIDLRKEYLSYCKAVPDTIGLKFITDEGGGNTAYFEVFNRNYRSILHDENAVMLVHQYFFSKGSMDVWLQFRSQYIKEYSKYTPNITDYITDYIRAEPITRAQEPTFEGYTKWLEANYNPQ